MGFSLQKTICLGLACLNLAFGFPNIANNVPNAFNVEVNGVSVVGLGHGSITSGSTGRNSANVFGKRAVVFRDQNRLNQLWPTICAEDTDGDGKTNGVELCDPDCAWRTGQSDPVCLNGAVLSHPGLGDGAVDTGAGLAPLVKAHAALMIMAWLFLAPTGILMATCLKKKKGKPTWFKIHKAAMLTAVILTILAFVLMIIEQGFSIAATHPYIGISVVALSILQPISGFLRPHNPPAGVAKTFNRLLWEFQHQWTGRIIMILAVSAVASGLETGIGGTAATNAGTFLGALLAMAGIGSFAFVFLVRDVYLPTKTLPEAVAVTPIPEERVAEDVKYTETPKKTDAMPDQRTSASKIPDGKNTSAKRGFDDFQV